MYEIGEKEYEEDDDEEKSAIDQGVCLSFLLLSLKEPKRKRGKHDNNNEKSILYVV